MPKERILITTGIYPPKIGGPAQYAKNLKKTFGENGYSVKVKTFHFENYLPTGIRHIFFFLKIIPSVIASDLILALDTFSVGWPTVLAAKIFRKKTTVRIGGDFLWEAYVNRTGQMITLTEFYKSIPELNFKEGIILYFTKILIKNADNLVFNTFWQQNIWQRAYDIPREKMRVIRNYIPPKNQSKESAHRTFLWAGRDTKTKNLVMLEQIANEIRSVYHEFVLEKVNNIPHADLLKRIQNCYAVILPSLSDVCPNFILEAASFNKPFIMTRETGLNEIYPKGGLFVNPLSKEETVRAIKEMLEPKKYAKFVDDLKSMNPQHSWQEFAMEIIAA